MLNIFRSEINEKLLTTDRERISVTDLLLKACATTLRAHPEVNAAWVLTRSFDTGGSRSPLASPHGSCLFRLLMTPIVS